MRVSPESTDQAWGATKQMCGLRRAFAVAVATGTSSAMVLIARSGHIPCIDTFELPGDVFDAGVRAHPALLLRGDRLAIGMGFDDRLRERFRRTAADDLRGARQDVADVGGFRAHDRHAEGHA